MKLHPLIQVVSGIWEAWRTRPSVCHCCKALAFEAEIGMIQMSTLEGDPAERACNPTVQRNRIYNGATCNVIFCCCLWPFQCMLPVCYPKKWHCILIGLSSWFLPKCKFPYCLCCTSHFKEMNKVSLLHESAWRSGAICGSVGHQVVKAKGKASRRHTEAAKDREMMRWAR